MQQTCRGRPLFKDGENVWVAQPFQIKWMTSQGGLSKWLKMVEDSVCQDESAQASRPAPRARKLISISAHSNLALSTDLNFVCPKPHLSLPLSVCLPLPLSPPACAKIIRVKSAVHSSQECFCVLMSNWSCSLTKSVCMQQSEGFRCNPNAAWGNSKGHV